MKLDSKIVESCVELVESGATKGKVEGFLKYVHDCSTNEAKEYANAAFKQCGLSPNAYGHADHEQTVKYLRANYGKIGKKELIDGMCQINGKTYATNNHAYNYIAMMIEWAKQEMEANS